MTGRRALRTAIVACQLAATLPLVAVAALFGDAIAQLTSRPLGFNPNRLAIVQVQALFPDLAAATVDRADRTAAVVELLESLGPVRSAAAASALPGLGQGLGVDLRLEGGGESAGTVHMVVVTAGYFDVLETTALEGRVFRPSDVDGPPVAVVSEGFAARYMAGNALGQTFSWGGGDVATIVGVVPDVRHFGLADAVQPAFYTLHGRTYGATWYVARTASSPERVLPVLRGVIGGADPDVIVTSSETMEGVLAADIAEERLRASLAWVFGAFALLLAAIGLHGAVARAVAERRREFGIRIALGAPGNTLVLDAMGQAARSIAIGIGVGIPLAVGATSVAASRLVGTTPPAAAWLVAAAGTTAVLISLLVSWMSSRRVRRIDPAGMLREG